MNNFTQEKIKLYVLTDDIVINEITDDSTLFKAIINDATYYCIVQNISKRDDELEKYIYIAINKSNINEYDSIYYSDLHPELKFFIYGEHNDFIKEILDNYDFDFKQKEIEFELGHYIESTTIKTNINETEIPLILRAINDNRDSIEVIPSEVEINVEYMSYNDGIITIDTNKAKEILCSDIPVETYEYKQNNITCLYEIEGKHFTTDICIEIVIDNRPAQKEIFASAMHYSLNAMSLEKVDEYENKINKLEKQVETLQEQISLLNKKING